MTALTGTIRVLVGMEGGTIENVLHDAPGITLDVAFLENTKYLDGDEADEVLIGDDEFLYTRLCGDADADVADVFRVIEEADKKAVPLSDTCCPSCGSWEIEGNSFNTEEGKVTQDLRCLACDAEWTAEYTLSRITLDTQQPAS